MAIESSQMTFHVDDLERGIGRERSPIPGLSKTRLAVQGPLHAFDDTYDLVEGLASHRRVRMVGPRENRSHPNHQSALHVRSPAITNHPAGVRPGIPREHRSECLLMWLLHARVSGALDGRDDVVQAEGLHQPR